MVIAHQHTYRGAIWPLVKVNGGAMPPSVSALRAHSPWRTSTEVGGSLRWAAAASRSLPAVQPWIGEPARSTPGAYWLMARWNSATPGLFESNHGASSPVASVPCMLGSAAVDENSICWFKTSV